MYIYIVTLDNDQLIKFDDDENILSGKRAYDALDLETKNLIRPDIEALKTGLDRYRFKSVNIRLDWRQLSHK